MPYDEVYDEATNLVGQHEADEVNNWQHFLVNPAFDEKKIDADYHADHQSPTPHDSSHETMITLDEDDPNLNDFNDIFNMALLTSSDASSTSSYFAGTAWSTVTATTTTREQINKAGLPLFWNCAWFGFPIYISRLLLSFSSHIDPYTQI